MDEDHLMKRRRFITCFASLLSAVLLTLASSFLVIAGTIDSSGGFQAIECYENIQRGNDWWMMYRHEPSHRGYSTITAPDDSQVLWSYQTNDVTTSSPAVTHGRVYVGSWDWNVYCFNMDTGNLIWSYSTDGPITSSPTVINGKVYVGSQDTKLYCLYANNGTFIWECATDFLIETSPTVVDGMVFFGSSDGSLYCLNGDDGSLAWSYQTGSVIVSSPAVVNGVVYFGATNGDFLCLDSDTGDLLWIRTMSDGTYSSPAIDENKIYFGSNDRNVYCLDAADGSPLWNYSAFSEVHSSPAIAYNNLYIGTSDGRVLCLEKDTGDYVWSYQISGSVNSAPSIADGKVYFGTDPCCGFLSYFICLDAFTGAKIWDYNFNTQFGMKSSPALAAGKVYASAGDGLIYAFGDIAYLADANGPYDGILDVPVQFTGSVYGGEPGFTWLWDFGDGTTSTDQNPLYTYTTLGQHPVTLTVTDNTGAVATDDTSVTIELPNTPPEKPIVNGTATGKTKESYSYTFSSTDINDDTLRLYIDWGDNTSSGWIGPVQSGVEILQEHSWSDKGSYSIKAKAKDSHGVESLWSDPFEVTITAPELGIDILGGVGVTVTFTNTGDTPARNISWNASFVSGVVIPAYRTGVVPMISAGEQASIHLWIIGLGRITIRTSVTYDEGTAEKVSTGVVFLCFVIGLK
jgi:outer membrane protein assembly factor BamB